VDGQEADATRVEGEEDCDEDSRRRMTKMTATEDAAVPEDNVEEDQ
jgi:hypothetical protein